jgi:hypothetical protein
MSGLFVKPENIFENTCPEKSKGHCVGLLARGKISEEPSKKHLRWS